MTTVILEGKEYILDVEQAEKLRLLKEKDDKVKSWGEFMKKYSRASSFTWAQLTQHEADAITAFSKLIKLRRDWIGEWEPDWTTNNMKGSIYCKLDCVDCDWCTQLRHPLSFPTLQMAREFLETFRDLIEEAKILI